VSDHYNITRIKVVYSALEELASQVVFVGGATVSLYKDRIVSDSRVTDDVDIVVEIAAYREYAEIEEKLRSKGFTNDMTSKIVCRYIVRGVIVDIMPTSVDILGFTNLWYADGVKNTITHKIDESTEVKIFDAVHFWRVN
jgi:transcription-repair coupling factor (superfamily II helicase)